MGKIIRGGDGLKPGLYTPEGYKPISSNSSESTNNAKKQKELKEKIGKEIRKLLSEGVEPEEAIKKVSEKYGVDIEVHEVEPTVEKPKPSLPEPEPESRTEDIKSKSTTELEKEAYKMVEELETEKRNLNEIQKKITQLPEREKEKALNKLNEKVRQFNEKMKKLKQIISELKRRHPISTKISETIEKGREYTEKISPFLTGIYDWTIGGAGSVVAEATAGIERAVTDVQKEGISALLKQDTEYLQMLRKREREAIAKALKWAKEHPIEAMEYSAGAVLGTVALGASGKIGELTKFKPVEALYIEKPISAETPSIDAIFRKIKSTTVATKIKGKEIKVLAKTEQKPEILIPSSSEVTAYLKETSKLRGVRETLIRLKQAETEVLSSFKPRLGKRETKIVKTKYEEAEGEITPKQVLKIEKTEKELKVSHAIEAMKKAEEKVMKMQKGLIKQSKGEVETSSKAKQVSAKQMMQEKTVFMSKEIANELNRIKKAQAELVKSENETIKAFLAIKPQPIEQTVVKPKVKPIQNKSEVKVKEIEITKIKEIERTKQNEKTKTNNLEKQRNVAKQAVESIDSIARELDSIASATLSKLGTISISKSRTREATKVKESTREITAQKANETLLRLREAEREVLRRRKPPLRLKTEESRPIGHKKKGKKKSEEWITIMPIATLEEIDKITRKILGG